MRHRRGGLKLNRTSSHRNAMFRNMVTSLFKHDRIRTTDAKAKELRRWADRLITLAKRGDLHARRSVLAVVREKAVVHKLFDEAPKRFGSISGGYTRVIKIGRRAGDAAPISLVELVSSEVTSKKKAKRKETPIVKETPTMETKETVVEEKTSEVKTEPVGESEEKQETSAPVDTAISEMEEKRSVEEKTEEPDKNA